MTRPIQPKLNKDYWGFYQVGPYKTYSKLDAIEASGRLKHDVVWNFNNEAFSQYDWTQEPPGTLDFWYRQRAEQLRDYYDYLILFYSGGWDANNILRIFVENNIFIDEIVHMATINGFNGDKNVNANKESFDIAIPLIKNLIETNPTYKTTKQTIVDISSIEQDFLNDDKWDYFYKTNIIFSPAIYSTAEIRDKNRSILSAHEKYSKVGQIYGIDKPSVWLNQDGSANLVMYEVSPLAYNHAFKQAANKAWAHDEMFYWTPDMPEILCKQAHTVLRYLKNIGEHTLDSDHTKESFRAKRGYKYPKFSCVQRGDNVYYINDKITADLLYQNNSPNLGVKPSSFFFGGKDKWLWNRQAPDIGQKRYLKGLVWLKQTVLKSRPDMWWDTPGDPKQGILPNGGFMLNKNVYSLTKGENK